MDEMRNGHRDRRQPRSSPHVTMPHKSCIALNKFQGFRIFRVRVFVAEQIIALHKLLISATKKTSAVKWARRTTKGT